MHYQDGEVAAFHRRHNTHIGTPYLYRRYENSSQRSSRSAFGSLLIQLGFEPVPVPWSSYPQLSDPAAWMI